MTAKKRRYDLRLAGLGTELIASVVGLGALGWWIDRSQETAPWGLVICATIGFVGGMDIPLIRHFACGYAQGAKAVNPDITIIPNMTGTTPAAWNDPVKGAELAKAQISQGADVIYAAAGGTGVGVAPDGHPVQVRPGWMPVFGQKVLRIARALDPGAGRMFFSFRFNPIQDIIHPGDL